MGDFDQRRVVAMLGGGAPTQAVAVDAIQEHGLASLVDGTSRTVSEIASLSGLSRGEIEGGIRALVDAGRIDLDGDRVVGVGGLTLISTAHSLRLPSAEMHTWCALDAVGIPAAFGLTATVATGCPQCDERTTVDVNDGAALRRALSPCSARQGSATMCAPTSARLPTCSAVRAT